MAGKKIQDIFCWKITSDDLKIYLASSKKGAVAVSTSLVDNRSPVEYFSEIFPTKKLVENKEVNDALIIAVNRALAGKPYMQDLSLDINCTSFQRRVLEKTAQIPFGQVQTYGDIARLAESPRGGRAVGQVMNKNPLPIIFPCHRVVASNGLGGFNGGVELKKYLLDREALKA